MYYLNPIESYVVELLRAQNEQVAPSSLPDGVQWSDILNELAVHTVQCVPVDAVQKMNLSSEDRLNYRKKLLAQVCSWNQYMVSQEKILGVLQESDIPVAVIKGAAAAASYPNPTLRIMGDIDLLVKEDDFQEALNLLRENGWGFCYEIEYGARNSALFKPGYPKVELHYRFSKMTGNDEQNAVIDSCIANGMNRLETIDLKGFAVPVLPDDVNGLVLLDHMRQHIGREGLGLRQVLDWAYFAQRHIDDTYWNSIFEKAAGAIGLKKLAITCTAMSVDFLGLQPSGNWMTCRDQETVQDLMALTLKNGNFGRKADRSFKVTSNVLRELLSPKKAISYLYESGCRHWPAAKGRPVLAPFACLYQIGRLAKKSICRFSSPGRFLDDLSRGRQEEELLSRLYD